MVKIQFLTILLVVTSFLGGVVSITDKEFQVSDVFMKILLRKIVFVGCFRKLSYFKVSQILFSGSLCDCRSTRQIYGRSVAHQSTAKRRECGMYHTPP